MNFQGPLPTDRPAPRIVVPLNTGHAVTSWLSKVKQIFTPNRFYQP